MLLCFANISDENMLHVLSNSFWAKQHFLTQFCQMLMPFTASEILCSKAALIWRQKC